MNSFRRDRHQFPTSLLLNLLPHQIAYVVNEACMIWVVQNALLVNLASVQADRANHLTGSLGWIIHGSIILVDMLFQNIWVCLTDASCTRISIELVGMRLVSHDDSYACFDLALIWY